MHVARLVACAAALATFTACAGGALDEDEACDLSVAWLEKNGLTTLDHGRVRDWELRRCTDFRTMEDEDAALITVVATHTVEVKDPQDDKNTIERDLDENTSCTLIDWDQGWKVEACIPAP